MKTKKDPREETTRLIRRLFNQVEADDIWNYVTTSVEANVLDVAKELKREEDFVSCGAYPYQKATARKTINNLKKQQLEHKKIAALIKQVESVRAKIKKLESQ